MSRQHAWFKPITAAEAEKIAGKRLDRRIRYYVHTAEGRSVENPYAFNGTEGMPDAKLLTYDEWTADCSGCTDTEYGTKYGPFGCKECGYTGKRRDEMHAPHDLQGDAT
jgi:hypothetical protein